MAAATAVCLGPVGAAGAAVAAPPPPPGVGIRLIEAPASRKDDPRARSTIVDHVKPGTTFSRKLEATNGDATPFNVKLYVRPAAIARGAFSIDDKNPGEITEWATITPATARVPARGATPAVLRIAVPANAVAGEYYGAAIVEKPPPPGATGARLSSRAAIAIYLSVGAGGEPPSDFKVTTLTARRDASGAAVVSAQVTNTGKRALSITGDLKLADGPGGLSAGPFPAKLGTVIGLGESEPVTVLLDKALPAGPWKATLTLRSGRIVRTSQGSITFPDAGSAEPVQAKLVEDDSSPPWPAIIGGVLGLLALGLLLFFFLKRRSRPEDKRDQLDTAQT
jgi:hypothetical protein